MSTEAVLLAERHWQAQARIGAGVAAESLTAWSRVSPLTLTQSGTAWLAVVLAVIRRERTRSRDTAAAFYRLHRALETGRTVPPLHGGYAVRTVPLADLRAEWARVSGDPASEGHRDRPIILDPFDWPTPDPDDHEAAARTSLAVTGIVQAQQAADQVTADHGTRLDAADFLADLDQVMGNAGATAAGAADREALRGGRDLISTASRADTRVLGWARITDGDPCAFCAMLASRGAVYKSRESAALIDADAPPVAHEDMEKFHAMCHCQTVPVYSRSQMMPRESEKYRQEWTSATRGLTGKDALAAWRKHIAAQRRTARG